MSSSRAFQMGVALALGLTLPAQAGWAQGASSMAAQIAELGGGMHAAARACGDYTDEQLRDMKQQQKADALAAGLPASTFETVFQAAYDKARGKLAAATPAQKAQACQQVRALADMNRGG